MIKIPLLVLALAAILLPSAVQAGRAQSKTNGAVIMAVTKDTLTVRNGVHAGYKIVNIDNDGLRNTQGAANVETFTVKPWTTVVLNGLPAKLTDLKPGLKVFVNQGTDPSVADRIVAMAVPPPQAANATDKTPPAKGKGPRKLNQGVDAYKVTAVTAETITVAQDGGKKSISYKIGKFTDIIVNGDRKALSDVKVGMEVAVVASTDPALASSIKANDPD